MGGTDGVPEHLVEQIAFVAVLGSLDAAGCWMHLWYEHLLLML